MTDQLFFRSYLSILFIYNIDHLNYSFLMYSSILQIINHLKMLFLLIIYFDKHDLIVIIQSYMVGLERVQV